MLYNYPPSLFLVFRLFSPSNHRKGIFANAKSEERVNVVTRGRSMGHERSVSPAFPVTAACTRAPRPGPPRPAGRSSPGPRSRAYRWPGSPVPDPDLRALSPRRPARQDTLPPPQASAGSEAQGRRPTRSRRPRSPGQRSRRARHALLPAPGSRLGGGRPAPAATRPLGAPLTFGRELAGGPPPSCPGGNPA